MRIWICGAGLGSAMMACSLLTDLSSLGGSDASIDAPADVSIDAPPNGFVLSIAPAHVTMDVGDSFPIGVTITRGTQFSSLVNVGVNGLPSGMTVTALTILANATTGTFNIAMSAAPPQTDFVLTVYGASTDGSTTSSAPLGVHYGSLIVNATADTSITLPAFATALRVKAWGAGGAGGMPLCALSSPNTCNTFGGGGGGGGGYAEGTIPTTPGETLLVDVGGGGPAPNNGGGYSGLFRGTPPLVIAGGGGGASSAWASCSPMGGDGNTGAAGGGMTGQSTANAAGPGTQMAGGSGGVNATAGTSLQGGAGANASIALGGKHGGGPAGTGVSCSGGTGGGGGGGYYGGGGGGFGSSAPGGAGGGGSAYVIATGTKINLVAGVGNAPANAADAERGDAGAGGAAGYEDCNPYCKDVPPTRGGDGRVIVRLVKP